jgi:hypothetical protein
VTRSGISEPAATKDLSLYAEIAPTMLEYDLRQRCYVYAGGTHFSTMMLTSRCIPCLGSAQLRSTRDTRQTVVEQRADFNKEKSAGKPCRYAYPCDVSTKADFRNLCVT